MKKQRFTSLFNALLACMAIVLTTSCNDSNSAVGTYPDDMLTDFVSFVSTSDKGSVFTFQKSNDSDLITLTAAVKVDTEKVKPNSRVIIQYVPSGGQGAYQSGEITLYTLGLIINGGVEAQPLATIESWAQSRFDIKSITRSGTYLNIWALADYRSEPARFTLALDEATKDQAIPTLYLVFEPDNGMTYTHQLYASLNLAEVWGLSTCKGVDVVYKALAGNETIRFDKPMQLPLEPIEPGE